MFSLAHPLDCAPARWQVPQVLYCNTSEWSALATRNFLHALPVGASPMSGAHPGAALAQVNVVQRPHVASNRHAFLQPSKSCLGRTGKLKAMSESSCQISD